MGSTEGGATSRATWTTPPSQRAGTPLALALACMPLKQKPLFRCRSSYMYLKAAHDRIQAKTSPAGWLSLVYQVLHFCNSKTRPGIGNNVPNSAANQSDLCVESHCGNSHCVVLWCHVAQWCSYSVALHTTGIDQYVSTSGTGIESMFLQFRAYPHAVSAFLYTQYAYFVFISNSISTAGAKRNGMLQGEREANSVYHFNNQQVIRVDLLVVMVINRVGFPFTLQHVIVFCTSSGVCCSKSRLQITQGQIGHRCCTCFCTACSHPSRCHGQQ